MTASQFVAESNFIEGILRKPTTAEVAEFERFMGLDYITVEEMERFVSVYQPGAKLRDKPGLNVCVGCYIPPKGGKEVRQLLQGILSSLEEHTPFQNHLSYERLHPFTDGNGRSGRILWAWNLGLSDALSLGFLHRFYYQALSER